MKTDNKQVVGAIIIENGKVFAAKRGECRYSYVAHKYEFAGGKVEQNETLEQALQREMQEELQMKIRVLAPYRTVVHEYPDFTVTLHTFLCQRESDYTLMEHTEARWIPLEKLVADEWAPADKSIVDALKKKTGLLTE